MSSIGASNSLLHGGGLELNTKEALTDAEVKSISKNFATTETEEKKKQTLATLSNHKKCWKTTSTALEDDTAKTLYEKYKDMLDVENVSTNFGGYPKWYWWTAGGIVVAAVATAFAYQRYNSGKGSGLRPNFQR